MLPAISKINKQQDWKKKFRITPSLPFAIELPRLCPWLSPSYFLEYPFCNQSDETITIKEIDFRAEDPFEVVKIQIPSKNGNNGEMVLKKGEKENVIFKIQVKPNQQQIFNDILKSLQKQQEKTVNLGSIFLQWGQFGVMVGQTVPLKIVSPDLALEIIDENIEQDPNSENHIWKKREFYLEQVQKIRVKVHSPTQKDMELKIHLQEKDMENIKVLGYDKQFIKLDIENPSQEIIFIIMPINAGIFQIKGIHLINTQNNQSVFFKNQLHIRAQSNDLGIQEIQSEQNHQQCRKLESDIFQDQQTIDTGYDNYFISCHNKIETMNNFPYTLESSSNLSFDSSDCSNIISNKNNRIVIYLLGFSEQSFKVNPTVFTTGMRNYQCTLKSLNVDFSDCQDQIEISIQSLEVDLNNEDVILNNLSSQLDWNDMEDNQFDFNIDFQKYIDNDGEIEVDWNLDENKRSTWKDGEIIDFLYYNNSNTDFYFGQNLYIQCELIEFQLSIQYAKNIMMAGFSFINQIKQINIENFNNAHLLGIKLLETSQIGKNMLQINTGSNIKINQLIIFDIQQSVENQYSGINFNNVDNIQIYNFVIKNCISQNLGIIKIQDASQVLIKKGYILENQLVNGEGEGGAIYIKGLNFCNYCHIQNSYFEECKSTQFDGGGLHLTESQNFILQNINFTNNYSEFWGGAIFTEDIEGFIFYNLIFNQNYAENEGGAIYLSDNTKQCIFQDLIFKDNVSGMGGGLGGFNNQNLNFNNIKFINNVAMEGGGALFNQIFDLILINIEITGNYAENGGGIAIMDVFSLYMDNIILNSNEAEISGGGMSIIFGENTQLKNIECINNNALFENGGGIFIDNDSMSIYENIQINNSHASLNAGGFYLGKSMQINIKNLNIQNSYAEKNGGGIMLSQCEEIYIYNSNFLFNIAEHIGGGTYVYFSMDINIINSEFNYNEANSSGGGIYSSQNEFFMIDKCTIKNNVGGTQGGGVVISESIILELIECEILKNYSEEIGGGVFINADSDEIIFQNTKISQNQADEMGAGVYIEKSWFISFEFSEIIKNQQNNYGSGIYCLKTDTLYLENTIISDHSSYKGGALYSQNTIFLEIVESEFLNNNGVLQGGSLQILEAQFVEIFDSLFKNSTTIQQNIKQGQNSIYSQGGAISYESGSFFGFFNSEVYSCSSYYQGGGIYLNNIVEINIEDSKFEQNKVQYDPYMPLYQKNTTYLVTQGGSIFIQQNILSNFQDKDVDSMSIIFIINNEIIQSMASSGAGIYISVKSDYIQEIIIEQNIFLENIGDLGSAIRILGSLQEYEYQDILENQFELAQNDNLFGEKNEIYFNYYKNEYIVSQDSNQFALCSQGSFLNEGSGSQYCNQCLDNGDCEGGYVPIYPSKYYWRENKDSTDFIYCSVNPENCLGNDTCQEGYAGVLCKNCDLLSNYAHNSKNSCKYIFNKPKILSGVIKVSILHAQILYLLVTDNLQLPNIFTDALQFTAYFKGITISFIMTFQPGYLESSLLFVSCQKIGSFYYSKEDSHIMCNSDFYKYEVLPINLTISVFAGLLVPQSQKIESNQRSQQQQTSKFKDAFQKSEILTYRDEANN
ncbi:Pectin lyase fold/virulence factor [Pseudocohnilembus persalinus]|uniref:Pectin lyase fold/virulence factor n=1 Tax=Pseudocohnilembus persalinus TaxID=266149 RepID=A0A0V0R9A2_PSEPJ|nr:Pectin lyase fold/virulence factor [Pseudocohnilembus persalinus]|eukprot:KRX11079.1 Pectin lyase fold/virulence factor [Pseudocohnilembus persalinus]